MKNKVCLALLLAALPLTPASAGVSGWLPWNWFDGSSGELPDGRKEAMHGPDLPGFVVVHEKSDLNQSIREEVPKGQTN